jgi:periplasmic protein CpxP/Spy
MTRKLGLLVLSAVFTAAPALLAQSRGAPEASGCCALLRAQLLPAPAPNAPPQPALQVQNPSAQPSPEQSTPPPAAEPEEGAPLSKLGLSNDQKKQIHAIRRQAQEQVQAVRNNSALTPQQQTHQIRQIRRKALQQVEGVLTPEQREKYDAWIRSHRRHRRGPPAAKQNGTE